MKKGDKKIIGIRDLIDDPDWRRENLDMTRDYEMLSPEEFLEKWGYEE